MSCGAAQGHGARSDLAFIAGYHGLAELRVGEIARIRPRTQASDSLPQTDEPQSKPG